MPPAASSHPLRPNSPRFIFPALAALPLVALTACVSPERDAVSPDARTRWIAPAGEAGGGAGEAPRAAPRPAAGSASRAAFEAGEPLDLVALTDLALDNNPSTRLAWAAARAAAAQRLQARSAGLPQAAVGYSWIRQNSSAFGSETLATTWGPTYQVSQLLWDFGGTSGRVDAASEALTAANFTFNQSLQDVILEVRERYYGLAAAEASLAAARATLEDARTAEESARVRFDAGLSSRGDFLRAVSNLRSAELSVARQQAAIEQSRAALALALGVGVHAGLRIAPPRPPEVSEEMIQDLALLTERAIGNRPDLRAARASLRAQEASHRADRTGYLPTLSAGLSGQQSHVTDRSGDPANDWTLSLSLSWSVFDGFATAGRAAQSRAQVKSARETLRRTEHAVVADVWTQHHALRSAVKQIDSARALRDSSTEAFETVREGYRTGINSLTDLLAAQSELEQARQQIIQAESDLALALARLARATGLLEAGPDGADNAAAVVLRTPAPPSAVSPGSAQPSPVSPGLASPSPGVP